MHFDDDHEVIFRLTNDYDYTQDFIDTLSALRPVELTPTQLKDTAAWRDKRGIYTYVGVYRETTAGMIMMDRGTKDGIVVATATLFLEKKFIHKGGIVGHIEDVAIHKDWQGGGIGRELISHVIDACRTCGCYKVILNCAEDKDGFYRKLGFKPHGLHMRLDCVTKSD